VRDDGRRVRLVVVGDGPLRDRYRAMAAGDPDVQFAGAVLDERPRFYADADVYACPTSIASFGITLLEAAACATPIVCSDIRGFDEVVQHEREALMVRPGDAAAFAEGLARLLDDDALRARLGTAGRERALQYDWDRVADRVLDVYARLLGHASAAA
jgi:phosphatidylinositol alpha-mannosyltransferase